MATVGGQEVIARAQTGANEAALEALTWSATGVRTWETARPIKIEATCQDFNGIEAPIPSFQSTLTFRVERLGGPISREWR